MFSCIANVEFVLVIVSE